MSLTSELSKVKGGFVKVKNDMIFLSSQISENYETFSKKHNKLAIDIHKITSDLSSKIEDIRLHIKNNDSNSVSKSNTIAISNQNKEFINEVHELRKEISLVKREVSNSHKEHENLTKIVDEVKKNKSDIKEIKSKLKSSELEIYLLKEKLIEKDGQIKNLKDISRKLFELIDELSHLEIELINLKNKSKNKK